MARGMAAAVEDTQREVEQDGEAVLSAGAGEQLVSRGGLTLRFLLNQRTKVMRVIDFRAGPHPDKLTMVQEVAERSGMQRAFTLVEREEAPTWVRLGFEKEGIIPGFYKRSDAHVLGLLLDEAPARESAVRIKLNQAEPADAYERAVQSARRMLKGRDGQSLPAVKVALTRAQDEEKALEVARASGRQLTDLAPFGRDVKRSSYLCTARGGFSLLIGVELQPCFDNALLQLLTPPRGEKELFMMAGALDQVCRTLSDQGVVSVFSLVPAESVEMSAILLAAGFRRTGIMPRQLWLDGPTAAQIWARKLAEPT